MVGSCSGHKQQQGAMGCSSCLSAAALPCIAGGRHGWQLLAVAICEAHGQFQAFLLSQQSWPRGSPGSAMIHGLVEGLLSAELRHWCGAGNISLLH
jgi:hypothetical protein